MLNNTKKLVRSGMTKVSNAYNKLKSGAKSALRYMGKSIKNFFVPESAYASSGSSSSTKKSAPKQTDLYQQILLSSQYYQYVQGGGTKSFDEFKNSSSVNNAVHGMLDLAGLLFDAADAINAAWYAAEGDYENAGISGMRIIPVIGIGKTGPRVAKTTKNMFKASEAGKAASNAASFEKELSHLPSGERVAHIKKTIPQVLENNGCKKIIDYPKSTIEIFIMMLHFKSTIALILSMVGWSVMIRKGNI